MGNVGTRLKGWLKVSNFVEGSMFAVRILVVFSGKAMR